MTRQLVTADPTVRVLVLSASGEHQDVLDAIQAGATGHDQDRMFCQVKATFPCSATPAGGTRDHLRTRRSCPFPRSGPDGWFLNPHVASFPFVPSGVARLEELVGTCAVSCCRLVRRRGRSRQITSA